MNWLLIIAIILIIFLLCRRREGIISKPVGHEIEAKAKEIIGAREDFADTTLENARRKLPWLDNVMYEDLRSLARSGKFDTDNIKTVFS